MKLLIERGYIIIDEDGVFVSGRFVANLDKLLNYDTASNEKMFFSSPMAYSLEPTTKTNIYTGAQEPYKQISPSKSSGIRIVSEKIPEFRTNDEGDVKIVPPVDSKLLFQAIVSPESWRAFTAKPKKFEESLMESVEKDLAAINKEAEHEVLQSKMEKIQSLIDKKQSQLSKLDEDEDMKSLTDDKKVKEISKDIKALEKAKAKLEKLMSKSKGKGTKKEVIDEVEGEELDQETINGITKKYNDIYEKNGEVTDQDIEKIADQYPFNEKSSIIDYLDGYDPGLEFDI
jgi:phosphatidylserine decarboxylase